MEAEFELYENNNGEYRGRLVRADGQTIVDSREYYKAEANVTNSIKSAQENAHDEAGEDTG